MSRPPLGLQAIVLGNQYSIEDTAVLDHVAACGYEALECGAKDPERFRAMIDARGLRYAGSHTGVAGLLDVGPLVEKITALGGADLCNSGLMEWDKRSLDDYLQAIDVLNRAGRELREQGIHLHYHNHDFEFEVVADGKTGMQILLDGLDPAAVDLCVDVGWVKKAGHDPAAFLVEHRDRVGYLHLKDFNDDGWIELGQGHVDFAAVMEVLPQLTGVRWVLIEQDSTRLDPLDSVAISRRYMKEAFQY